MIYLIDDFTALKALCDLFVLLNNLYIYGNDINIGYIIINKVYCTKHLYWNTCIHYANPFNSSKYLFKEGGGGRGGEGGGEKGYNLKFF